MNQIRSNSIERKERKGEKGKERVVKRLYNIEGTRSKTKQKDYRLTDHIKT